MLKPPDHSFFLLGPRGAGKSTWIRQQLPDAVVIDLLDDDRFRTLSARPERLASVLPADVPDWVVIDEVQRVPAVLNEVHRLIESRGLRFALTVSSARKLRRGGVNLLAGRALHLTMHPLVAEELGREFDVERALDRGLLPSPYTRADAREFLRSYVAVYLKEEVLHEGLTRNFGAFSRCLEALSFSQAQPLNISAVARECGVERTVVAGYVEVLEDLLLAARVPAFTRRARRRVTKHPKFMFFDTGVYQTLRPRGPLDSPEEVAGPALETLVYQHLRAVNAYMQLGYTIHHWRSAAGHEVDFVLYGERGLIAIEVKRANRLRGRDLKGLRAFMTDYPMARGIVLYGGDTVGSEDGIEVIPLTSWLSSLSSEL